MSYTLRNSTFTDVPIDLVANPLSSKFDSTFVTPDERLKYWCAHATKGNGLKIHCDTNNFLARITERDLGKVKVFAVDTFTPHRAERLNTVDDLCFINLQRTNDGAFFRGEHEVTMGAGSLAIYEAKSGYELDFIGSSRSIVLAVPKALLADEVLNLEQHLYETVIYNADLVEMLAVVCRKVLITDMPMKQPVVDGLGDAILKLVSTVLQDANTDHGVSPTHGQAAILFRIKRYLRDNISDPDICPNSVASSMNITVSYLHKVFRAENTTLMQFVLAERLERCRCDLARKARTTNISNIAYNWGFNDASHFTRSFRKRFNVSPSEYRHMVANRAVEQAGNPDAATSADTAMIC